VIALHPVLLDPRQPLAGLVGKIGLLRLPVGAARHDQRATAGIGTRGIVIARIAKRGQRARMRKIERIELACQHVVAIAGQDHAPGLFIDTDQAGHFPVSLRQLLPLPVAETIEMAVTIAFGPPDQAAVGKEAIVVRQVDPAVGAACSENSTREAPVAGSTASMSSRSCTR
jgi:hypothetical protein